MLRLQWRQCSHLLAHRPVRLPDFGLGVVLNYQRGHGTGGNDASDNSSFEFCGSHKFQKSERGSRPRSGARKGRSGKRCRQSDRRGLDGIGRKHHGERGS